MAGASKKERESTASSCASEQARAHILFASIALDLPQKRRERAAAEIKQLGGHPLPGAAVAIAKLRPPTIKY